MTDLFAGPGEELRCSPARRPHAGQGRGLGRRLAALRPGPAHLAPAPGPALPAGRAGADGGRPAAGRLPALWLPGGLRPDGPAAQCAHAGVSRRAGRPGLSDPADAGTNAGPWPASARDRFWGLALALFAFAVLNIEIAAVFAGAGRPSACAPHGSLAMQLAYSIGWLLYAIGLLAVGIRWQIKAVRWAAILAIVVTACKIFLLDVSSLGQLVPGGLPVRIGRGADPGLVSLPTLSIRREKRCAVNPCAGYGSACWHG